MRDRSERNWHTAEPRREARRPPDDAPAGSGDAGDALPDPGPDDAFGDGATEDGYMAEGGFAQRRFDASMRPGARGNRAGRFTGEGEDGGRDNWSHAEPGGGDADHHEWRRRERPGSERPNWRRASRREGEPGGAGASGHAAQPQTAEWYGEAPGDPGEGSSGAGPQPSPGFGWGGAPTGRGEWGGLQNGPSRAERGGGGYGSQRGSPAGTQQADNSHQSRDDWYRDHSMRSGEPWTIPGPYTGRGPRGYERSDRAILEDVCERLTRHGEVDATNIQVRCEGREVILEGTVEDRRAKRLAEDTAESVSGVRDIQNLLRIHDGSSELAGDPPGQPEESHADTRGAEPRKRRGRK